MAEVKDPMQVLQEQMAAMTAEILELKSRQAKTALDEKEPELPTIPKETVKRGDKEYQWQVAIFSVPLHGKVKAEEAALSDDIIDLILSVPGQGILKELA